MISRNRFSRRQLARQLGSVAALALAGRAAAAVLPTPAQVEGPFHPIEPQLDTDLDLVWVAGHDKPANGEQILVQGQVLDVAGNPLAAALVDVWQANSNGRYSHPKDRNTAPLDPDFQGWGLLRTDSEGRYALRTIRPGAYPLSYLGGEGWRCQHIHFKVSHPQARPLTTQMYFAGDPLLAQDMEIAKAPPEQRRLLISSAVQDRATGLPRYRFDIVLDREAGS